MPVKIKEELKELVVVGGLTMVKQRLTVGTWGNISIRDKETGLIYISPSGVEYEDIRTRDIVVLSEQLEVVEKTAQVYIMAMSIGTPKLISEEDIREMRYFARNIYGQKSQARSV